VIKNAITDEDINNCFDVMSELRTNLTRAGFLKLVRYMETEGYLMAYLEHDKNIVAVAGYRIFTNLFMGKNLYIDDLVTADKERSNGYGEQLVRWLRAEARSKGCRFFHLDSGTHRDRTHKFYFENGFSIASYHFSEQLKD